MEERTVLVRDAGDCPRCGLPVLVRTVLVVGPGLRVRLEDRPSCGCPPVDLRQHQTGH